MSPCYNYDPGAGYVARDPRFATQQECEENCAQVGACCTPTGCEQRKRCECNKEDGEAWLGNDVPCDPDPCDCTCDAEGCGFEEGTTATITFYGLADSANAQGFLPSGCINPPASSINERPICLLYDPSFTGNHCSFRSVGACFYSYRGLPEQIFEPAQLYLCFNGSTTTLNVRVPGGKVSTVGGAGDCAGPITISNVEFLGDSYDTTDAYCVIDFTPCELPVEEFSICCFHCTAYGDTPVNLPDTIDVTISNVASNNPGTTGYIEDFVEGTYTLTRSGCDYVFSKNEGSQCFPAVPLYGLALRLSAVRESLNGEACESGYRWRLFATYESSVFGCIPANVAGRLLFYEKGDEVHEIPNCCAAETFSLTGQGVYSTWTADFEVHCD